MEAEAGFLLGSQVFGILVRKYPALVRRGEFQFVAVEFGLVRRKNRPHWRQLKMTYARQLVVYLTLLGLQLYTVGK